MSNCHLDTCLQTTSLKESNRMFVSQKLVFAIIGRADVWLSVPFHHGYGSFIPALLLQTEHLHIDGTAGINTRLCMKIKRLKPHVCCFVRDLFTFAPRLTYMTDGFCLNYCAAN